MLAREFLALKPELAPAGRALGYFHIYLSADRRHRHRSAKCRLPGCNRYRHQYIPTLDGEMGMRCQFNLNEQIARLATAYTGRALAFQANVLAFTHTSKNLDLQGFLPRHHAAMVVDFVHCERHLFFTAVKGLFQEQGQAGVNIFPAHSRALAETTTEVCA